MKSQTGRLFVDITIFMEKTNTWEVGRSMRCESVCAVCLPMSRISSKASLGITIKDITGEAISGGIALRV
jgi:hypothetical protein